MPIPLISPLVRVLRHRREVHALTDLDHHLLADIGLLQTDVRAALARPLLVDPSRALKAVCCHWRSFAASIQPPSTSPVCCA